MEELYPGELRLLEEVIDAAGIRYAPEISSLHSRSFGNAQRRPIPRHNDSFQRRIAHFR